MNNKKSSHLRQRLILGTSFVATAFLGGYRGYVRRAYAACTGAGGTYTCSGALTTTQTLSGAPLNITTAPGFSITTAIDRAFKLIGTNGLTFTDNNHSTISTLEPVIQPNDAIYARNLGSGTLSITTTGTVDSKGTGINAANDGSDLTITAADVSGITAGIIADNRGSGALSITTTGNIRGTGFEGIHATGSGTDITVTTGAGTTVTGDGGWAVDGQNSGTGALTINVNGNLVAFGQSGSSAIYAKNFSGTDLTINAAAGSMIRGDGNSGYGGAVYANNQGTGTLTITTNGDVKGTNNHGLFGKNYGSGLVVTVGSLGTVNGATDGILAQNYGAGALAITVSGAVTGTTAQGVYARNDSATAASISTVMVAAGGTVTGGSAGIQLSSTTGRDANVTNAGAITGNVGILGDAGLGAATITNSGNITGTAGTAINLAGTTLASTINQQGGAISGNILLSAAADQVNVTGGTIAGNITGQGLAVVDFALGGGSFTLSAPYAITGMTNVILDSGTMTIAGSTDSSSLTINGGSMTVTGAINATVFNLNGGLLSVGSGSNLGASSGTIVFNGGALENSGTFTTARNVTINSGGGNFETDADLILSGTISGSGALAKNGPASLILSGSNNFSGGTTITAGTLIGTAASFGSGAILDNANLVINQPIDGAFANAVNGTGSFTKQGAGRLNYTGTGTLSGTTTVAAGTLAVNGSLATSAVTVQSGAALGGNGTVGATIVQANGTIAPGNSIGTLHINGAFTQASGSIYQVEVDPGSNASDRILVNGTATLQTGAGLNVVQNPAGSYQLGTVYTVLTASGGLNGSYVVSGQTTDVSAFLSLKDSYDANNAYLTVIQTQSPIDLAATPSQQAVANAVQALPPGSPLQTAVLNAPDATRARAAFNQLSGQSQASAQGALLGNGLYVRDVAFDRLRDVICAPSGELAQKGSCDGKKLSLWAQGFGGWGGIAGDGNVAGLNHSAAGFLVGVDVPVEDFRLGLFGGYSHSDFKVVTGDALGDSNDYHLGLYGGTLLDNVAVRVGGSYSWSGITTDRAVNIGTFSDALHAIYNAGTTQAFGELGYGVDLEGVSLEPFANLTYVNLHTGGFSERGGAAALTLKANTLDDTITTLGIRPSTHVTLEGFEINLRGMAGWRHTFGTITPTSLVSLAGSNFFNVSGASLARDAAALEAGLDVTLDEGMILGLTYGGQLSSRTTDQTVRGTIRFSL